MKLSLGCDPEIFMADAQGRLRASCGLIGGSKVQPLPLTQLGEGYAVQEDNVAIEFNIPPAADVRAFQESIKKTLDHLSEGIHHMYDFKLVRMSAASFPETELQSPAAREFGCDPDYNAWTGKRNPKPKADDPCLRSCGGHVHIGFDKNEVDLKRAIKMCDLFMGVPSVLMDEGDLRKKLYGKRGAYRDKSFGGEYRVMSNFWIWEDLKVQWVWDNVHRAIEAAKSPFAVDEFDEAILDAIDNNNKEAAMFLVKQHNLEVLSV